MNLNKNFLTEVIKYLINRGVTLTDVLDTFNEHFNNNVKHEPEITNGDIDLLLCGRSVEESSTPEKPTESVTIEPQTKADTDTRVNDTNANSDAIRKDKNDVIEKALKKFVTHSEESQKDKKPKEPKKDYTVTDVCFKLNVTTHELKKMINSGEFPQPDCDKKWSVKLLKKEGII